MLRLSEEDAILSDGVEPGEQIVALGAHLLSDGQQSVLRTGRWHPGEQIRNSGAAFEKERNAKSGINLSALAVRERSVTLFFLLAVIIAGAFAYFNLGRAEDPSFTIKVFTVTGAWPGATAQEMQDLEAEPLEKRMQELTYYDHVDTLPDLA